MTILEIEGRRIEVEEGFKNLSPAEQERTVEEIASRLRLTKSEAPKERSYPVMSQVNRGIADAVGGAIDFVNPFDKPHGLNPFPQGTGSAQDGLQSAMKSIGTEVAEGDPETVAQAFWRGSGEALGAAPIAGGVASALGAAPGVIGRIGADAAASLSTRTAPLLEMMAGGLSGGARQLAEDAGAPDWVQNTAAIVAPMSIPVTGAAARATPAARIARGTADKVKAAAMPFTKTGAEVVASQRAVQLAGGPDRAAELRDRIGPDNPLNLTPAQQTEDPNMLAIEQMAARENPDLRARLEAREEAARAMAVDEVSFDGDVTDTRAFFETRRRDFAEQMRARVQDAIDRTQAGVDGIGPVRTEEENAILVSRQIRAALDDATMQESALWEAVPKDAMVGSAKTLAAAQRLVDDTTRFQRNDIPAAVREILDGELALSGTESVRDMHGLYSELRRVARAAMAGNDQKKNMARIANSVADAVLDDLGAYDGATEVGRSINEARAFSAELHKTFDQGEVGRLLKKTLDGDLSTAPELALRRTVARPGVAGMVGARDIERAAPASEGAIRDFIKGEFGLSATSPGGEFTRKNAQAFMRKNRALLERYPDLRKDITEALSGRMDANDAAVRLEKRLGDLQERRLSAGAALLNGPPSSAIKAFTEAKNPVKAARLLRNEAEKDETGNALAGLKSLVSSELTKDMTGAGLSEALDNPKTKAAFRVLFEPAEISRMRRVAKELSKLDRAQKSAPSIGASLSGAETNKAIEMLVRIGAAKTITRGNASAGADLQAANMASSRAKEVLGRLTRDRASAMLADAVEDPELFRLLLSDIRKVENQEKLASAAWPYLAGALATSDQSE